MGWKYDTFVILEIMENLRKEGHDYGTRRIVWKAVIPAMELREMDCIEGGRDQAYDDVLEERGKKTALMWEEHRGKKSQNY